MLSVALLSAQGVTLHVHTLDHDHHHGQDLATIAIESAPIEHTHISIAHLSTDVSHSDHHDEVISESDACPDCLLTKISSEVSYMGLLAVLFMLVLSGLYRNTFSRQSDKDKPVSFRRYHLIPVLRAPPR